MTKIELPVEATVPPQSAVGQQETWFAKRAARKMVRAIRGARGVKVPGVASAWNLHASDLFTATVRAWIEDEVLPQNLVIL
jgi:hypothetical protein